MKPVFDADGLAAEPGDVRCFYYDAVTGEYTGWSDEYIHIGVSMPGNATDIAPGDEVVGEVAVFSDNNWKWLTDHRNEIVYSTMDGTFSAVDYIGEVKEGFTTSAPATPHDVWDGEKWVTDSEAQHVAEVAAAETEKQTHIYQTNTYINSKQWPGKAAMGRLKDTEKEQYNLWLDYLDALEAVDILNAPDINWPVTPEV